LTTEATASLRRESRRTSLERLSKDGEQETASLARTSLCTSHQVTAGHDDRDGVLLDWGWLLVTGELDVAQQMLIERRVLEASDWVWDILTRGLDRDVVVLVEVDAGLLLGGIVWHTIQLALGAWVCWARDVLAINPLAITGARRRTAGASVAASSTSSTVRLASGDVLWVVVAVAGHVGLVPGAWGRRATSTVGCEGRSRAPRWRATVEAVLRRSTVAVVYARRTATHASTGVTHVRWDIGAAATIEAILATGSVLGVVDRKTVHVKLISHVG
jgi:hypothetical protein